MYSTNMYKKNRLRPIISLVIDYFIHVYRIEKTSKYYIYLKIESETQLMDFMVKKKSCSFRNFNWLMTKSGYILNVGQPGLANLLESLSE